jgi:hypothetical protein
MTKKRKNATNINIMLNNSSFINICSANPRRSGIIISNGEIAGKDAWLFFGNIGNAMSGKGYFLEAKGIPYKSDGENTYTGPICGIGINGNVEIGMVEY